MARARAARAPNRSKLCDDNDVLHIHSPVFRVMRMEELTASDWRCLCEAAVCAKYLSVDPSTIGSSKEGDDVCDIVWLAEPLERSHAADLLDLICGLAVEKELGCDRPGGDGIDSDLVATKLVGKNLDEPLDACLGGDVRAVGG